VALAEYAAAGRAVFIGSSRQSLDAGLKEHPHYTVLSMPAAV